MILQFLVAHDTSPARRAPSLAQANGAGADSAHEAPHQILQYTLISYKHKLLLYYDKL